MGARQEIIDFCIKAAIEGKSDEEILHDLLWNEGLRDAKEVLETARKEKRDPQQ